LNYKTIKLNGMNEDEKIFETLVAGGIIGAALGVLVSKNKGEGATLGALAGAAILATFKANEKAMQANVPMYVEQEGYLCQILPNGTKTIIRKIEKPTVKLQQNFKLK
jgi:hypothetical protein